MFGICLVVAYDGTAYSGWQEQPNAKTVQGELQSAIATMAQESIRVRGASRTDAGVHALGQVAAFDVAKDIAPDSWRDGLNRYLPDDIAVQSATHCAVGYEPRFDSAGKHYRYLLMHAPARDPFLLRRAWQVRAQLDLDAMRAAANVFIGTHDFAAFRSADDERENTVRTIDRLEISHPVWDDARLIGIDVHGSAFMKQMVRIMAGTLVDVGLGRKKPNEMPALIQPGAQRGQAGPTAPAHGLTLVHVRLGRNS